MAVSFSYAAIDFETTGSVQGFPVEPWQIGIFSKEPGRPAHYWESLLRVGDRPFHPRAPGRHARIRNELAQAPLLNELLTELRPLLSGKPLLAHNAATERQCLNDALPMEDWGPWVDTLKLARAAWPDLTSHKLEDLLDELDLRGAVEKRVPGRRPHDALFDACASAEVVEHLMEQPGWKDVELNLLLHPDTTGYSQQKNARRKGGRG